MSARKQDELRGENLHAAADGAPGPPLRSLFALLIKQKKESVTSPQHHRLPEGAPPAAAGRSSTLTQPPTIDPSGTLPAERPHRVQFMLISGAEGGDVDSACFYMAPASHQRLSKVTRKLHCIKNSKRPISMTTERALSLTVAGAFGRARLPNNGCAVRTRADDLGPPSVLFNETKSAD